MAGSNVTITNAVSAYIDGPAISVGEAALPAHPWRYPTRVIGLCGSIVRAVMNKQGQIRPVERIARSLEDVGYTLRWPIDGHWISIWARVIDQGRTRFKDDWAREPLHTLESACDYARHHIGTNDEIHRRAMDLIEDTAYRAWAHDNLPADKLVIIERSWRVRDAFPDRQRRHEMGPAFEACWMAGECEAAYRLVDEK